MRRLLRRNLHNILAPLLLLLCLPVGCREDAPAAVSTPTPSPVIEPKPEPTPLVALPPEAPLSQEGIDLIINAETGGKFNYDSHPEWPGGSSGVTIGIGDDLGFKSKQAILSDWHEVRSDWLNDLADTSGITGEKAKPLARNLSFISIEWRLANQVFTDVTLPQYWSLTKKTFPGVENLCANARSSLVSVIYNRGSSMVGDSRKEMRTIREMVPKKDYDGIAQQLLDMRRLWYGKGLDGLIKRRADEANLVMTCANKN